MISSSSNVRMKQVIQWQTKAKERRNAGIFLIEGIKLFEEAPEQDLQEIYVSEGALEKIHMQSNLWEKLEGLRYEVVTDDVFAKISDTQTPQGILCVVRRPEYQLEQMLKEKKREKNTKSLQIHSKQKVNM